MKRVIVFAAMAIGTVAHGGSVPAVPSLPPGNAKVFTYDNGLTLIVEEDRGAPVASVQAWCGTGSIHEAAKMGAGLSHILEHMLFKGTATRPPGSIAKEIQEQGGYINAYTSFDRTVYWIDVPKEGAGEAVAILADAMMNASLPEQEYVKEQEVIRREFAMGFDDPDRQATQLMLRTVFSNSPFRHPVIGYLDVYNKLTREDVLNYYKARYVPNNLTFVVVGDVDANKIHEQLGALFDKEPRHALEPVPVTPEPPQLGKREAHEEFPTELSRSSLAWRIPGLTDPDTPALDVLGEILGSGRSSLLNREIREKKQLAHDVSAGMFSLQTDGVFIIQSVTDPDKRPQAEAAALETLSRVKTGGVTQEEVDRAKRSILAAQLGGMSTMRGKASSLGSDWMLTRNLDFSRQYLESIGKVTPDDVRRVAREYLREDRLNATSLDPVGTLKPEAAAQSAPRASDIQMFTLPNGLRLLVREDTRLPLVAINAVFRAGLLAETPDTNGITRLMAQSMLKGTKTLSAEQIAAKIENCGGSIAADSGNNSFGISVSVMQPDLSTGLDVLADVLSNPSFPGGEVEIERNAQLASIKADDEQPTSQARNLLRKTLFGPHPYGLKNTGSAEAVSKLTPDDLRKFHDRYVTGRNGVISVFGDVKASEVKRLVEKAFAKLPEGELAFAKPAAPAELTDSKTVMGAMPKKQAIVMQGFLGASADSPDRTALELINEASNDLGSRFFNRIREKMGLAYFVGAGQFYGLAPGAFLFYLGTDPAKVEAVRSEFRSEIDALAKDGLTDEELARAKKKLLGGEAIRNQSNAAFAAACAVDELMGLGWDAYKRRREEVEKITLDDVRRVAAKYFQAPGRVEVVVSPNDKPAPGNH